MAKALLGFLQHQDSGNSGGDRSGRQ
jgi:hypothetical protein